MGVGFCPECGRQYPPPVVVCRDCRAVLSEAPPAPASPVAVVWGPLCPVSGLVEGRMLCGALESQGLHPRLVSFDLPAYAGVRRDWSRADWGEIRVPADELLEAQVVLGDFLKALRATRLEPEASEGEPGDSESGGPGGPAAGAPEA